MYMYVSRRLLGLPDALITIFDASRRHLPMRSAGALAFGSSMQYMYLPHEICMEYMAHVTWYIKYNIVHEEASLAASVHARQGEQHGGLRSSSQNSRVLNKRRGTYMSSGQYYLVSQNDVDPYTDSTRGHTRIPLGSALLKPQL